MKNLLLISQDTALVDLVSRVAVRSGVELVAPESPIEATKYIQEEPVNLILLDLVPRAQRLAYLEQIRSWSGSVPLIALMDLEDQVAGSLAYAKGADATFRKPLSEHTVEKIVQGI